MYGIARQRWLALYKKWFKVSIDDFIASLSPERVDPVTRLLDTVRSNIPSGFVESVSGGMVHFVVPLSTYPAGYHVGKESPLPFISIASQKGHVALYHFGIYVDTELMTWFQEAYAEQVPHKPDMGKSCIRFKKPELIPFELIGELMRQRTVEQWVACYDRVRPAGR